ncbi:IS110 family transposase [Dysgonomonas sp. 521]|uniref:IS110 family transposase n=1 Tax=Dysgonomonas sp. 521 TaxID=2302932 RepID=UPI0013D752E1|nr:IS110 family transposase [Dysgonomonas sp. 521]
MSKVIKFEEIHANGAGIDIGSREIYVSLDGLQVVKFKTFTSDYHLCCQYLKDNGISSVAMEATGVYWMSLYSILEDNGLKVCLVHPREVQQVKGRKTDVKDSQWIQKLYCAGLLRESIVAKGKLKELRVLVRERMDLIDMGSTYVNKMQKYLELMNIKLHNVISQIHGASGLRIIKAILSGERDAHKLVLLCDSRILNKKREEVKKSLEGNYSESYLLCLAENLSLWEKHQQIINSMEQAIGSLLDEINQDNTHIVVTSKSQPSRHHNPQIEDLHKTMVQLYGGVNLTTISGINDSTMLRLLAEVGNDMSRFPTKKHFVSWVGLSPKSKQSGKMKKRIKSKSNNAGLIFRQSAQSLLTSKNNAIGAFIRRIKGKKGSKVAIKAGARKIAEAFYNALTKGADYVETGANKYIEQVNANEIRLMGKLAKKHNFMIVKTDII